MKLSCAALALYAGLVSLHLSAQGTNQAPSGYDASGSPGSVETVRLDWLDASRDREVPAKIYYPKTGAGPFPVIIFSHGLGGSRDGYEYLGRHWAGRGYVSVHVQHLGSDSAVWEGARPKDFMKRMEAAAADLANITNRPLDISFAISQMERLNEQDPLFKGRLDLGRIGVAGHSFGAYTTLAVAGETFVGLNGEPISFVDRRVKAAIAMSSPAPQSKWRLEQAFGSITIPCLHMTGTKDTSPIGKTTPAQRRLPYDYTTHADKFLITFSGGDHMIFSGRGRLPGGRKDEYFQRFITLSSTAFWDAYLRGDAEAKAWLTGGDFKALLGKAGTFEEQTAVSPLSR